MNPDPLNPLRSPLIPDDSRKLADDERTCTHDQIWDHRASRWIEIGRSFLGLRAGTFTCVIRAANSEP